MTKLFLDTNVWIRFFARDNNQFEIVKRLLQAIEQGKFAPYTSSIVLLEVSYVLQKNYDVPREKIYECLETIIKLRGTTVIDKTSTKRALKIFRQTGMKLGDCLIASQIPKGATLVTFDKEFAKIKGLIVKTPAELLS